MTRSLDCRLCYKKLLESLRRKNRVEKVSTLFFIFSTKTKAICISKMELAQKIEKSNRFENALFQSLEMMGWGKLTLLM